MMLRQSYPIITSTDFACSIIVRCFKRPAPNNFTHIRIIRLVVFTLGINFHVKEMHFYCRCIFPDSIVT